MEHMPLSLKVDRIIDHAEMPKSGDQTTIQKLADEDEFKGVYLTGFPMDSANTFQVTGSNIGWGKAAGDGMQRRPRGLGVSHYPWRLPR